jgi:Cu/Zn superoxide dismutase
LYKEYEGRIRIKLRLDGTPDSKLTPGLHAIHIHETGNCELFSAAKGTIMGMWPRALIVHEFPDKYLPEPPHQGAPVGPRIGCGVIVKQ